MTHLIWRSIILVCALAGIVESAQGQICVTSDDNLDTACGTGALATNSGSGNTAVGASALNRNT